MEKRRIECEDEAVTILRQAWSGRGSAHHDTDSDIDLTQW